MNITLLFLGHLTQGFSELFALRDFKKGFLPQDGPPSKWSLWLAAQRDAQRTAFLSAAWPPPLPTPRLETTPSANSHAAPSLPGHDYGQRSIRIPCFPLGGHSSYTREGGIYTRFVALQNLPPSSW